MTGHGLLQALVASTVLAVCRGLSADPFAEEVAHTLAEGMAKVEALGGRHDHAVVSLDFTNSRKFTGEHLREILPFRECLYSLNLSHSATSDRGLERLSHFSQLRAINLAHTQITDKALPHLALLKNLQRLELTGTAISGDTFVDLNGLEALTELYLGDTKLSAQGAKFLKLFQSLENVSLGGTQFSNASLSDLAALENLAHLDISRTNVIGDVGFGELRRANAFRNLETLAVGGTHANDALILHIAKLPRLRALAVQDTRISPKGIQELARLRHHGLADSLQVLRISDYQLSDESRGSLREAFPELALVVTPSDPQRRPQPLIQ